MTATAEAPASVAALAESPPLTDVAPASTNDAVAIVPASANNAATAAPGLGAAPIGAGKPHNVSVAQHAPPPSVVPAVKKKLGNDNGLGPLLRHLFSAHAATSYSQN